MCIYSDMFKLQSPSKYFPFDAIHPSRCFSTAQNSFWTCWFWCLLVLLPFFVSPLPYWQNVSLWRLFSSGQTKNVARGEIGWIGRIGHGGYVVFGQKLLNTQRGVGRYTCKSPIMKWTNALSLQKNSLKLNTASHNNTSWYTDADGCLEHLPSRWVYYRGPPSRRYGNSGVF